MPKDLPIKPNDPVKAETPDDDDLQAKAKEERLALFKNYALQEHDNKVKMMRDSFSRRFPDTIRRHMKLEKMVLQRTKRAQEPDILPENIINPGSDEKCLRSHKSTGRPKKAASKSSEKRRKVEKTCTQSSDKPNSGKHDWIPKTEAIFHQEPLVAGLEPITCYIPYGPFGILPAYRLPWHHVVLPGGKRMMKVCPKSYFVPRDGKYVEPKDYSSFPKDQFGKNIPDLAGRIEEAAEFFRKQNWTTKKCHYCKNLIDPNDTGHLYGKKDETTGLWIEPTCLEIGEDSEKPSAENPGFRLLEVDVDPEEGIYIVDSEEDIYDAQGGIVAFTIGS